MATAHGIIQLSGKLGRTVFTRKNNKTIASQAPEKPHKLSERSRLQTAEFGQASSIAALIRHAIRPLLVRDTRTTSFNALNSVVFQIINTHHAARGKKRFLQGNIDLLTTFNFNNKRKLRNLVHFVPSVKLDLPGNLRIAIPPLQPASAASWPTDAGAESLELQFACAVCDPKEKSYLTLLTPPLHIPREIDFPGNGITLETGSLDNKFVVVVLKVNFTTADRSMINVRTSYAIAPIFAVAVRKGKIVKFKPLVAKVEVAPPVQFAGEWEK